jgi:hypothetical protein
MPAAANRGVRFMVNGLLMRLQLLEPPARVKFFISNFNADRRRQVQTGLFSMASAPPATGPKECPIQYRDNINHDRVIYCRGRFASMPG